MFGLDIWAHDRYLNSRSSFVSDISTGNSRIVSPKHNVNLAQTTAAIKTNKAHSRKAIAAAAGGVRAIAAVVAVAVAEEGGC